MRYISIFSGVEAASVAWGPLGWEPVAFSEVEPFPCAVLEKRFPDVPNLGDIRDVDWTEVIDRYGAVDVVVGGSPCQSFSVAGGREGLDGESRLMYEYIRAVREIRPRWFLWENVPGVFSTDSGRAFGILLGQMEELGYGLAWRVLDAQFFGVAQRRRRVFLVGCLGGGGSAAAVLFESESVRGNTQTSKEKRAQLASDAGRSTGAGCQSFKWHQGGKAAGIGWEEEQLPTLNADWHAPAVIGTQDSMIGRKDGGQRQTVCMASCHTNAEITFDVAPTQLNRQYKDPPIVIDRAAFNQGENAKYPPPYRAGGGNGRAGRERTPRYCASNGQGIVGPLCARDHKGVGEEYVQEGKVICQTTDALYR